MPVEARRHAFVAEIEAGLRCSGVLDSPNATVKRRTAEEIKMVIGVSGGADSVALLLGCLVIYRRRRAGFNPIRPIAVHVHHHLRESADADARWVRALCDRFGIELHVSHVRPGALPGNVASNARRLRYKALCNNAHSVGASYVAVAHHAEDQLETILIALCRGAGLDGLSAMPWSRSLDDSVKLVRPLLNARKRDCEEFCRAAGVKWREDPSNADLTKRRARIRHDVLPVLEELWPDAARRAGAAAKILEAARAALHRILEESFGQPRICEWDRAAIARLEAPIIAAGLHRAAIQRAPNIADQLNHRHLRTAADMIASTDRRPRKFEWPGGLTLAVKVKRVTLCNTAAE